MNHFTATYSPEDNKLRLSAVSRLDSELYARVRAAGFIWAPKQEIFVAPMWTPERADLCTELAGEIGDEDTSLVARAEDRAERFEDYSESRAHDAESARKAVERITDGIPMGQPILVGHHSERHARKDAERIENGMRRAVKMWETSKYWGARAAGAIRHAKYKELPAVRARRIKGLEADKRREERTMQESETFTAAWSKSLEWDPEVRRLTVEQAKSIANYDHVRSGMCFPLKDFPRNPPISQYEGAMGPWSALEDGIITAEQARDFALEGHARRIAHAKRWLEHINNRLEYERAMLDEAGESHRLEKKPRPTQLPLCNYRAPEGLDIPNRYNRGTMIHYPQVEMTQAEYARINKDYKGTCVMGNSHRVRTAMQRSSLVCVFLTDSKTHEPPAPVEAAPVPRREMNYAPLPTPDPTAFDAMKDSLRAGVQVVAAPQLFPTPASVAAQMVELAIICPGSRILEPSAGTGNLIKAILAGGGEDMNRAIVAVEKSMPLADALRSRFNENGVNVQCGDFLEQNGNLGKFDAILMNPPFENGSDITHIQHAMKFLAPGGRLVAVCANGSRQNAKLRPLVESYGGTWEELPHDTFKEQGTGVRTVLLSLTEGGSVHAGLHGRG